MTAVTCARRLLMLSHPRCPLATDSNSSLGPTPPRRGKTARWEDEPIEADLGLARDHGRGREPPWLAPENRPGVVVMRFAHFVDKNNIGMLVVPAWQRQQLAVVAVWTRGVSSRYGDLPGLGRSAEPRL